MCRHAAYVGPPLPLHRFLLDPPHSLMKQAWRPREMLSATLNADGFGFGWARADGGLGVYTNPMPIWSDSNLAHLGASLTAPLWLANVRSATPGQAVNQANTHPFLADGYLFSHNGFVHDFGNGPRRLMRHALDDVFEASLRGSTDSELVFALLRQQIRDAGTVEGGLARLFGLVSGWLDGSHGLFNLILTDGVRVHATRHAVNHAAPSLYVGRDAALFGDGWLVASEPLSPSADWRPVPEGHLVVLEGGRDPSMTPL